MNNFRSFLCGNFPLRSGQDPPSLSRYFSLGSAWHNKLWENAPANPKLNTIFHHQWSAIINAKLQMEARPLHAGDSRFDT